LEGDVDVTVAGTTHQLSAGGWCQCRTADHRRGSTGRSPSRCTLDAMGRAEYWP
jgi:hypothetical protein